MRRWIIGVNDHLYIMSTTDTSKKMEKHLSSYQSEAIRTLSTQFYGRQVGIDLLKYLIYRLVNTGDDLDIAKKILFYGKNGVGWLHHDLMEGVEHPIFASGRVVPETVDTMPPLCDRDIDMLHAMIGVTTEAIELLQNTISILNGRSAVKDYSNIVEEMGDIYWYLAVLQKATGISEEKVKSKNIMKLRARYPEKFTTDDALNRDLDKEAEALSDGEGN